MSLQGVRLLCGSLAPFFFFVRVMEMVVIIEKTGTKKQLTGIRATSILNLSSPDFFPVGF